MDYQPMFFMPATLKDRIWGEPGLMLHGGTYHLIYDFFPHRIGFHLATSPDGVHWREEGEVLPVDEDAQHIECPSLHRFCLLMRRNIGEFYLEDYFVSSFKLGTPTGRIGMTGRPAGLNCWYSSPVRKGHL